MNPAGGPGGPRGGPGGGQGEMTQQQQPMMMHQQNQGFTDPPAAPAFTGGLPQAGQGRPGRAFDRHDPAFYKTRMCTQVSTQKKRRKKKEGASLFLDIEKTSTSSLSLSLSLSSLLFTSARPSALPTTTQKYPSSRTAPAPTATAAPSPTARRSCAARGTPRR